MVHDDDDDDYDGAFRRCMHAGVGAALGGSMQWLLKVTALMPGRS